MDDKVKFGAMDKVDWQGCILLAGFVGAHILAAIYDGDILKLIVGADIAIAANYFRTSTGGSSNEQAESTLGRGLPL